MDIRQNVGDTLNFKGVSQRQNVGDMRNYKAPSFVRMSGSISGEATNWNLFELNPVWKERQEKKFDQQCYATLKLFEEEEARPKLAAEVSPNGDIVEEDMIFDQLCCDAVAAFERQRSENTGRTADFFDENDNRAHAATGLSEISEREERHLPILKDMSYLCEGYKWSF